MADRQIGCNPVISKFARLLLNISLHLTPEDLSNIKLVLEVDGVLKRKTLDSLLNTADLFRLLYSRKIVQEDNLNLLTEILKQIHRYDCVKLIWEFTKSRQDEGLPNKGPVVEIECDSDLEKLNKFLKKKIESTKNNSSGSDREGSLGKSTMGSNSSDDDKIKQDDNSEYSLECCLEDVQLWL